MHPRSPYQRYVDFRQLANDYPAFQKFLQEPSTIDFKDPAALRELAKCLLERDFGLHVDLHDNRLCPMIPNRLDYVLWIQDLIDSTGYHPVPQCDAQRPVMGLDIGTGASCVYALLACAQRPSWKMLATDIDPESISSAKRLLAMNSLKLSNRIHVEQVLPDGPLYPLQQLGIERLDFTMCNPPFFTSIEDMVASAKKKGLPPSSACTGTTVEMVYENDGEIGFARRMLEESRVLREQVQWYTTLFGKLSSVSTFVRKLKEIPEIHGNWAVTDFIQGQTKRWAVAWSYADRRPTLAAAVVRNSSLKGCSPFPPELCIPIKSGENLVGKVQLLITGIQTIHYEWIPDSQAVFGEVVGDVWSRSARRAAQRGALVLGTDVQLGFLITIFTEQVVIRWTRGRDAVLFESFCGMLKRKLNE